MIDWIVGNSNYHILISPLCSAKYKCVEISHLTKFYFGLLSFFSSYSRNTLEMAFTKNTFTVRWFNTGVKEIIRYVKKNGKSTEYV